MLTSFIDDSTKDKVFVLAGFVAEADEWEAFSDAWKATLDKSPPIKRWKSKDANGNRNAFYKLTPEQIANRGLELAALVSKHTVATIGCVLDLREYGSIVKMRLGRSAVHPYTLCLYSVMVGLLAHLVRRKYKQKIQFIFDEQGSIGTNAVRQFQQAFVALAPEKRQYVSRFPMFGTDDEHRPLQAADMYAWELRSRWQACKLAVALGQHFPEPTPLFRVLDSHEPIVTIWTKPRLEDYVAMLERGRELLSAQIVPSQKAWDDVWETVGAELADRLVKRNIRPRRG